MKHLSSSRIGIVILAASSFLLGTSRRSRSERSRENL